MRKLTFVVLLLIVGSISSFALPSTISKSGKCKIQKAGTFDKAKIFSLELKNKDATVKCGFRGNDFFGKFHIFANPSIANLSGKPFHISYNAAFFDKDNNLIAAVSQSCSDVEVGAKNFMLGSAMAQIPEEKLKDITSYKLVIYISKKK
ncbi:MAG: hypothetical protein GY750_08520 [Lentisphaerae bacterium]|nr:hypothetical protein [Lentisphaerota bacterium]MCP4101453.1 hypothetical protein [Lentisphaerota bacterium]